MAGINHPSPNPSPKGRGKGERVLVITGPTGSGKTNVSVRLAELFKERLNLTAEIISADSRQVYKHIPIATSQPPANLLKKYKHHFIGELELDEDFSAGEFSKRARGIIEAPPVLPKGEEKKVFIVVGGSGLYINALVYGLFSLGEVVSDEAETKQKLKEARKVLYGRMEREGIEKLLDELKKVDPESAKKMTVHTHRRIIRALEIFHATGVPISVLHKKTTPSNSPFDKGEFSLFGIKRDRKKLYDRINERVEMMIKSGLIEEVSALNEKGYDYKKYNSLNTVGIKEVFDYLEGKTNYERMVVLIKQNTRRFAKRQMTWFRKDENIRWVEVDEESGMEDAAKEIFQHKGHKEHKEFF